MAWVLATSVRGRPAAVRPPMDAVNVDYVAVRSVVRTQYHFGVAERVHFGHGYLLHVTELPR